MPNIKKRLEVLNHQLGDVRLVAVSKYSPVGDVLKAYQAGQKDFGESKLQELHAKSTDPIMLALDGLTWHFIGPLQSNKVKKLFEVPNLRYVHSLHSLKVLKIFLNTQKEQQTQIKFFLQYNSSHEAEKQGFSDYEQLCEAVELIKEFNQEENFCGLMTMAVLRTEDWQEGARACFKECREMAEKLNQSFSFLSPLQLSMGMSRDFKIAIDEGTHWVRIGSSIFK